MEDSCKDSATLEWHADKEPRMQVVLQSSPTCEPLLHG